MVCSLHWQGDCVLVCRLVALSALPGVSIYAQLAANTLSFYLFALRIKQPHRVHWVCQPLQAPLLLQARYSTQQLTLT